MKRTALSRKTRRKPRKRYVLRVGYPWVHDLGPYYIISMRSHSIGGEDLKLAWPEELWEAKIPRYRLVLERID